MAAQRRHAHCRGVIIGAQRQPGARVFHTHAYGDEAITAAAAAAGDAAAALATTAAPAAAAAAAAAAATAASGSCTAATYQLSKNNYMLAIGTFLLPCIA
jgi:hypothetical protein